jgi:sterol O-acyltransferase
LKVDDEGCLKSPGIPEFWRFSYFLFAPTLIYRNDYPRNRSVRWSRVYKCLLELIGVIFYVSFLFERFLVPRYYHLEFNDQDKINLRQLTASIFHCMMPGLLVFLCGFYGVLHSWMNAIAEILKFGDRMFYKDWWNSTSFAIYYRTWNVVVHDWLYTYIYKDCYEVVFRGNKFLSQLTVFTISALVHEYILAFTFRFCYPVMFILFEGFGVLLMFVTKKEHKALGNIFMWLSLALGTGIMLSLYHMEYHARKYCRVETQDFIGYFIPRSWSCNGLVYGKAFGRREDS